jgi:hypothetical protein
MSNPARDRETVRRALWAGAVAWLVTAAGFGVSSALRRRGMEGETAVLIAAVALVVGGLAATLWLMLANVLDLFAGAPAGLRRWLWTAGILFVTALVVPAAASVLAG